MPCAHTPAGETELLERKWLAPAHGPIGPHEEVSSRHGFRLLFPATCFASKKSPLFLETIARTPYLLGRPAAYLLAGGGLCKPPRSFYPDFSSCLSPFRRKEKIVYNGKEEKAEPLHGGPWFTFLAELATFRTEGIIFPSSFSLRTKGKPREPFLLNSEFTPQLGDPVCTPQLGPLV